MPNNATCYARLYQGQWGQFDEPNWKPCGKNPSADNILPCCVDGDICLDDLICYNPNRATTYPGASGYYMAGCTDETYTSIYCAKQCVTLYATDVVYTPENQIWNCCGVENQTYMAPMSCAHPTNETFAALPPDALQSKGAVEYPQTGTAAAAATTVTVTPTAMPNSSNSHITAATAAGIGVGVAVGVLILSALTVFLFLRRRWRRDRAHGQGGNGLLEQATNPAMSGAPVIPYHLGYGNSNPAGTADATPALHEVSNERRKMELEANSKVPSSPASSGVGAFELGTGK